jgi:hypothetical protein
MSTSTPIIAILLAQQKRRLGRLRELGAIDEAHAIDPQKIGAHSRHRYDHLVLQGLVRVRTDGAVYLDQAAYGQWRERQTGRARWLLAGALLIAVVLGAVALYLQ